MDRLLETVAAAGVQVSPGGRERLLAYCRALEVHNPRAGLVSGKDLEELVEKHVAASLGPLLVHPPRAGQIWIDVGTGGGLPGMVVKLARPDVPMTLVDSSRKKTIFLEDVRDKLAVPALRILHSRVEVLTAEALEGWGGGSALPQRVILMRAVAPLGRALPLIEGIAGEDAVLITFKGPSWAAELEESGAAVSAHGWELTQTLQIPWAPPKLLCFKRM